MNEKYLYILMRNDLGSLGPGRAAAQASHAANAFIHKYGGLKDVKAWTASTPQGFGTAIVLAADRKQMTACVQVARGAGFPSEIIIDTDYATTVPAEIARFIDVQSRDDLGNKIILEPSEKDPTKYILHRQEETCAYIFGNKEELAPILGELPLYS